MKLRFQILALLLVCNTFYLANCKININIAGLYPIIDKGYYSYLHNTTKITEKAVEQINTRDDILPDYNLVIEWNETYCAAKYTQDAIEKYIKQNKYIVFGSPCLESIEAIENSNYYGFLFTFSEFVPVYTFGYFQNLAVNGFPTGQAATSAKLKFIQDHEWNRVAVISSGIYKIYNKHTCEFNEALNSLGIENIEETIPYDSRPEKLNNQIDSVIETIQSGGYKIIVFNTFIYTVNFFYCRISNRSLDFNGYTFIVQDIDPKEWLYRFQPDICPLENFKKLVNSTIGFNQKLQIKDLLEMNHRSVSGYSAKELITEYGLGDSLYGEIWDLEALYMYDGMWALGQALNQTIHEGYEPPSQSNYPNNYHKYNRHPFLKTLHDNIHTTNFKGVTGEVNFKNGLREISQAKVVEYSYKDKETVNSTFRGLYINLPSDISQVQNLAKVKLINSSEFEYWDSNSKDGIEYKYSHKSIFIIATVLAFAVATYIVVLIIIIAVAVYKRYPPATYSEPYMNIFLLTSNLFLLAFAVLLTFDGKFAQFQPNAPECSFYCHVLVWLGCVTCSLILGGVLAKALKLYALWVLNRFEKSSRQLLRFPFLMLLPTLLVSVDTLVIALWGAFAPIQYESHLVRSDNNQPSYYEKFCSFEINAPLSILLIIKVVLIMICIFLAYHLRNITHKSQRYTFVINFIMYNTLFFSIFIVVVLGFIPHFDTKIALASLMSILAATITASIIGFPILYYLYKDPAGKTLFNLNNIKDFPEDDALLRRRIQALEKDLEFYTSNDEHPISVNLSANESSGYLKFAS